MTQATLTIGGTAYDSWLARESLTVIDNLTSNPDTLDFTLNFENGARTACPIPAVGAEVIYTLPSADNFLLEGGGTSKILLEDGTSRLQEEGFRAFGGVLTSAPQVRQGLNAYGYTCSCNDYRVYADRKTLSEWYTAMTAGAIVVALFAKYAPDFDTTGVDLTGPLVPSFRCKRSDRITTALDRLSKAYGYFWDVTPFKKVRWSAPGAVVAPFGISDTSANFVNLVVTPQRDQLKNRVIVKGSKYSSSVSTVDRWTGDGLSNNFRLSKQPYGADGYVQFEEQFASLSLTTWAKADVYNPSPPSGHIGSDGFIFTTLAQSGTLTESGKLQVVGGDGVWGDSRLYAAVPIARGDGFRRFEIDVYPTDTANEGRFGLWNPASPGLLAGELYGFHFNAGTVVPSEAGVDQAPLNAVTYTAAAGACVRLRVVPGASTGAEYWCNTDAANGFRASQWVHLYSSATGSATLLTIMATFGKNFSCRVGRVKVFNRLYAFALTVAGVSKTVGLLNVDNDGGYDALIGTEAGDAPVLAFFSDTTPAAAAAIVGTYFESIPILCRVDDIVSQAAVKAIENPSNLVNGSDGVYEGYIEDISLDTLTLARQRGSQELATYSNPLTTVTFDTYTPGLQAGQLLGTALTQSGSGRVLSASFLIQEVRLKSIGSGNYVFSVTAGSRLKGIDEYLIDLLLAGKAVSSVAEVDNGPLDILVAQTDVMTLSDAGIVVGPGITATDSITFTDLGSVANGPTGPYQYTTYVLMEDGTRTVTESSDALFVEPACQYGLASYA